MPINIGHGKEVIQWERDTDYVRNNLINRIRTVAEGVDGKRNPQDCM